MLCRQHQDSLLSPYRLLPHGTSSPDPSRKYRSDAASQGLRVGMTVPLSLSGGICGQDYHGRGVPYPGDTEILDYGPEEEFELVGIFTYVDQPVSWNDAIR